MLSFCKNNGLRQFIEKITRPNKKGGSCIDLIMSNSHYVIDSGILDDIVSDHYTVFCKRKKKRETKEMVWVTVRDYSKFDEKMFVLLIKNQDWNTFDHSLNPNDQWSFIRTRIIDILSIMCPYKRVFSRKYKPLWITPEIYRAIRERKRLLKLYRATGCYDILKQVYVLRNKVNSLVDKAKSDFVLRKLNQNTRNPKKFWKTVNDLIKEKIDIDIINVNFIDPSTSILVDKNDTHDFFNNFFANIAQSTRGRDEDIDTQYQNNRLRDGLPGFDFRPVTMDCFSRFVLEIDLDMSSCIEGINMKICKLVLENFMDKWTKLYNNSLHFGIFPTEWACSIVTHFTNVYFC